MFNKLFDHAEAQRGLRVKELEKKLTHWTSFASLRIFGLCRN